MEWLEPWALAKNALMIFLTLLTLWIGFGLLSFFNADRAIGLNEDQFSGRVHGILGPLTLGTLMALCIFGGIAIHSDYESRFHATGEALKARCVKLGGSYVEDRFRNFIGCVNMNRIEP